MIDPGNEINRRFEKALTGGQNGKPFVPTIATPSEILRVPCAKCSTLGWVRGSFVPEGGMSAVACRKPCPECGGLGYHEHHFPAAIVKLAKGLAHQSELIIARTLCGFAMGMKVDE